MRLVVVFSWLVLAVLVISLVVQPIGLHAQITFSIFALIMMAAIHALKLKGMVRHLFLVLSCAIAARYLYWRATSTLPGIDDPASFIPGFLLFLAELYSIGMLLLSTVVSADPLKRKHVPLKGPESEYPTVDVYIPSYNEDDEILGTTVAAARNLDYPADKLNVYLLDDGGTDQKCNSDDPKARAEAIDRRERLQKFCKDLGVHYLTRAKNEMAKAGNLNNGIEQSTGKYVVVFDADHAPTREFLRRTIGHLENDDNLFLVQTPHFFLNADPVEKNLETFNIMPSENEMFYSVTQKGLDKWDGTFFCGSGAVLRREALKEVGGFKGVTITEDCETALELHSRGWSSAYVDEPLMAGFQPESVAAFLIQRSRWCQGMMQILILKSPLFKKGLHPMQRLAYLSSNMFWLFPLSRLAFVFAPALYIFFNLEIYNASFQEFLAYTGIFMIASSITQNYLYGNVRWPWISETYEYIQSLTLARVIFSTVMNPRKPTFKVTDKGTALNEDFFSEFGWTFLGAHFILCLTFVTGLYRLHMENYNNELLLVVTLWSFFNVVLGGLGLGVCAERRERRRHYRLPSRADFLKYKLSYGGKEFEAEMNDLAIGGVSITCPDTSCFNESMIGSNVDLKLFRSANDAHVHTFNLKVLWSNTTDDGQKMGLGFYQTIASDRRMLAFLMLPDNFELSNFRKKRKAYRSILHGTVAIIAWSFLQTARAFKVMFADFRKARLAKRERPLKETAKA